MASSFRSIVDLAAARFPWVAVGIFVSTLAFETSARAQETILPPDPLPENIQMDAAGVDPTSGMFHTSETDVVIGQPGAGGLVFGRIYSETGWRPTTLGTIRSEDTTYIVSVGSESESFSQSGGVYTPVSNNGSTLTFDSGANRYTYTSSDGTIALFDKNLAGKALPITVNQGFLVKLTAPNGAVTDFHYKQITVGSSVLARLQSVTNSFGYQLHFQFLENAATSYSHAFSYWTRIKSVVGINNAVDYCAPMADACSGYSHPWPTAEYGGNPFTGFTSITLCATTTTCANGSVVRTTNYTYSGSKLVTVRRPGSAIDNLTITYLSNTGFSNGYIHTINRGFGTWTYSYSRNGDVQTTTVTNPLGKSEKTYSSVSSGLVTSVENAVAKTTSFQYDSADRLIRLTLPEGNYVQYAYDSRGNLTETRRVEKSGSPDIPDIVTSATYPSTCANAKTCNKPTTTTDERGKVTDYIYDSSHGGVTSVRSPDPDGAGALVRPEVRYTYAQKQSRFKNGASTWANGALTQMLVRVSSCATTAACAGGVDETVTTTAYPASSTANNLQPISITGAAGNSAVSSTTTFAYDNNGDVATIDGPLSGATDTTRFIYDAARRNIGVVGPDADGAGALKHRAVRTSYSLWGAPTIVEQGTTTNQTASALSTFVALQRTETAYDSFLRPTRQIAYSGATATILAVQQLSYDNAGRPECSALRMNVATFGALPASACTLAAAGVFGADRIGRNVYSDAGQVLKSISAHGTALAQDTVTTSYTSNGRVASLTDARGGRTSYTYDRHDRLVKTCLPNPTTPNAASATDCIDVAYLVDGGRGTSLVDKRFLRASTTDYVQFTYDNLSRTTLVNAPGTTPDVTIAYDNFGRPTSASQPGHALSYTYDQLSRLVSAVQPLGTVSYQYDAAGRRTRLTYPGSYSVDYDYGAAGDLLKIRENGATSGVGVLATFAYDDLGRRTSLTRGNGTVTSYGFDGGSRLKDLDLNLDGSGTANDQSYDFAFNPASQIVSQDSSNAAYDLVASQAFSNAYTVDYLNKYLTAAGGALSYDARGNLTAEGGKSFAYDSANRLVSASGGGVSAALKYDPDGRLYEVVGTAATRFLYDGADIIGEYNSANGLLRRYVHGPAVDEPLVWLEGTGTADRRFLHADARGSIIALTSATGATLGKNRYSVFGAPHGSNLGRFQYTGQIWLAEAALYHYKARAYHPALGRFLQTDPIGYADGMNLYAYAGNDPVNATDPSGLEGAQLTATADEIVVHGTRGGGGGGFSFLPVFLHFGPASNPLANQDPCNGGFSFNPAAAAGCADAGEGAASCSGGIDDTTCTVRAVRPPRTVRVSAAAALFGISRGSLVTAGALAADDVTGIGVVDDVAIPPLLAFAALTAGTGAIIHANSLRSQRPTTVYRLYLVATGATLKFGITSQTPFTNRYSQGFLNLFGAGIEPLSVHPDRLSARTEEIRLCQAFTAANGHLPPLSVFC